MQITETREVTMSRLEQNTSNSDECMAGNWLCALTAENFINLANTEQGDKISRFLTEESVRTFKENPAPEEQRSWKYSLPALAKVLQEASLKDQIVILEYFAPSRDRRPSRIDAVICGLDSEGKAHAVLIELKQWSHNIYPASGDFLGVSISNKIHYKIHPRKQIETYRNHMKEILRVCDLPTDFIRFEAYAYLHNAAHLSDAQKVLLYGQIQFEEDSRLYTKDFHHSFAKRLQEHLSGGNGKDALKTFKELQILALQRVKKLPKRPNYWWIKIRKKIIRKIRPFVELLIFVLLAAGLIFSGLFLLFKYA